jgi:hypothetical protein
MSFGGPMSTKLKIGSEKFFQPSRRRHSRRKILRALLQYLR